MPKVETKIYQRKSALQPTIVINGVKFTPDPRLKYGHDYVEVVKRIKSGQWEELGAYKALILNDLWFISHFVMKVPGCNREFIVDAAKEVQREEQKWTLDLWARFHYKDVYLHSYINTLGGLKKFKDVHVGDYVFDGEGSPVKVLAETEVYRDSECYEITFDDNSKIKCGGGHLWFINYSSRERISGATNERIGRTDEILETNDIYKHYELRKKYPSRQPMSIYTNLPLKFPTKELPIQPYTLGLWLGDGDSCGGGITSGDDAVWGFILEEGYKLSANYYRTKRYGCQKRGIYGLRVLLRKLTVFNNKHIPETYFTSSYKQRLELLRGLMDSDGHIHTDNVASFCNINIKLCKDVKRLAESLGYKCFLKEYEHRNKFSDNYEHYVVKFTCDSHWEAPFKLERKASKIKNVNTRNKRYIKSIKKIKPVPTKCIQVEGDGSFLIGKECIVTHNSTILTKARTLQRVLGFPEKTTMIASHTRPIAKKFLRPIMMELEGNELLKACFPEVLYDNARNEASKWSEDDGIVVKRDSRSRSEATVEAWGIKEGMPISVHFDWIILDDLETKDDVRNPDVVNKVRNAVDLCTDLLTEGGSISVVGTPYSHEGVYIPFIRDKVRANGDPKYLYRRKPATHDGTPMGKPVMMTREELDDVRVGKDEYNFNCQQLINPTPVGVRKLEGSYLQDIEPEKIPVKTLFRFMPIDPAGDDKDGKGDAWAFMVVGVEPKVDSIGASNLYILDAEIDSFRTTDAIEHIVKMYLRNGMILQVGVEKVGMSETEVHVRNALLKNNRNIGQLDKSLVLLRPAGRSKQKRIIANLSWGLLNSKIFISTSISEVFRQRLRDELDKFPFWKDDGIDALSYTYDMLKEFNFAFFMDDEDEIPTQKDTTGMCASTGY